MLPGYRATALTAGPTTGRSGPGGGPDYRPERAGRDALSEYMSGILGRSSGKR